MFTGPGAMELLDMPEPDVADGDVLVHVRAAGICGSELHGARHPGFRVPPLIMGHEFAGISDDGNPVIINPILSCGQCDLCARGLRQVCRYRAIIGVHRAGGFAERVAVPRSALVPLPDGLAWDAATAVEPAANAVHAWGIAGGARDKRVAVVTDPGELVPHDQRRHPEAGMPGAVQLAAADPGRAHVHQDVTIGHVRLRHVEQLHRAWTGEHQRVHF